MELSATRSSLATEGDDVIDLDAIATVHNATVQGAVVVVAMPKEGWSGCLLIHAHGFRAEGTHLHAEVDDPFWWRLIQQGWAVGVTSYRRSGILVADAIKDINNLRNHVANEWGIPSWVFIDGRSMGGAISTRIAEMPNVKSLYAGVLAVGAALLVKEDDPRFKLRNRPVIPIVYLTNTSEIGPIETYIANVKAEAEQSLKKNEGGDEIKVPALHLVYREGHNWTNPRERWYAFSLLVEWAFCGTMVTKYLADGTRKGKAIAGAATFETTPDGVTVIKANVLRLLSTPRIVSSFTILDLAQAHIKLMSKFTIVNASGCALVHSQEREVTFGAYPFVGIPDDATVAVEDPEGYLLMFDVAEFRNQMGKGIIPMNFKIGEEITIKVPRHSPRARGKIMRPIVLKDEDD